MRRAVNRCFAPFVPTDKSSGHFFTPCIRFHQAGSNGVKHVFAQRRWLLFQIPTSPRSGAGTLSTVILSEGVSPLLARPNRPPESVSGVRTARRFATAIGGGIDLSSGPHVSPVPGRPCRRRVKHLYSGHTCSSSDRRPRTGFTADTDFKWGNRIINFSGEADCDDP